MTHALGIDVGTTNAKVALVDEKGALVASAARPITTVRDGEIAEQDPELLWTAVVEAIREVTTRAPEAARDVGHIGIDSQYSSTVPVDAAGGPSARWSCTWTCAAPGTASPSWSATPIPS